MTPAELLELLQEFYRDKLNLLLRHQAGARCVRQYDFNNTYQYVLAREETQLQWLADAIVNAGGTLPEVKAVPSLPEEGNRKDVSQAIFRDDVQRERAFIERWRDRADAMTHARHSKMLSLILGEMLEHLRFFEQAVEGRTDLLGRHAEGAGERGEVLPTRWVE